MHIPEVWNFFFLFCFLKDEEWRYIQKKKVYEPNIKEKKIIATFKVKGIQQCSMI